jgi:hypothetical protein
MNEVRKAVTNDDISDQENARFLFGGGRRGEKREGRSPAI